MLPLEIQSLAAICFYLRDSALAKGIIATISRYELSNDAQIRAEPVTMLILSVKFGRQMAIHKKSQKVFDFIDKTGLFDP